MEIQLNELITKIKKDGIDEAEKKAAEIIDNAEKEASEIIKNAKKEASEIISNAKKEQQHFENTGREALKQAGRDLILSIREKLILMFDSIIKQEVSGALTDGVTAEILPVIIKNWTDNGKDIEVFLSKEDRVKLEESLFNKLAAELKNNVTVKAHPEVKAGFRVTEKDGDLYYDFTDSAIAENLVRYLNPVLTDIIKKAASGK
ncbi:MAG: V-type ATP synthase subunit E [Spirochaetota bacterium]